MNKKVLYVLLVLFFSVGTWAIGALLMNVQERKAESQKTYIELIPLSEEITDPAVWGKNFPNQYDGYKRTIDTERTRYGGSEAYSKLDQNPAWKRIFAGYAFSADYREERGHAHSLDDQKATLRTKLVQQPGACLQCHAGGLKSVYESLGDGDLQKGFAKLCALPLEKAWEFVEHPISCVDCHDPKTMELRVTRPGFLNAIRELKAAEGIDHYDPNLMATHQEMRTFVCGQCHVEYYFKGKEKLLTYPWKKGLKMEQIEAYYDEAGFKDWIHKETGAPVLKAQHPEFELWNQGIHAKSGVSCVDCHMPYKRQGALKITDHHIRSPILNTSRACLQCHHVTETEMKSRVEEIQDRTRHLMTRGEEALIDLIDDINSAKASGAGEEQLSKARQLQRKAQWRLDFISAENSMGFHAPQESARILAEAIDYARQGQLALKE
jgi:nitrite reductase (cytochrome c-552)